MTPRPKLTCAVHPGSDIYAADISVWNILHPHGLPNTSAGTVEDVTWIACLLAQRDIISRRINICRIKNKHCTAGVVVTLAIKIKPVQPLGLEGSLQFVCGIFLKELGHVVGEVPVPARVNADISTIDKDGGLVIDGFKIEEHPTVACPVVRDVKVSGPP